LDIGAWRAYLKQLLFVFQAILLQQSTLQKFKLAGFTVPFGGIGQRLAAGGNHWPFFRQLSIKRDIAFQSCGDIIFRVDRFGRAFWFTQSAIDALVWVNYQEIGTFMKAIDRANFHAIGVFAADTVLNNDKWHGLYSGGEPIFWPKCLILINRAAQSAGFGLLA